MTIDDLYVITNVNLDAFTETFAMNFYLHYLSKWPECCFVAEVADGTIAGYMIGKVEGYGLEWHGHCSAVTVAPEYRRTGLANLLMQRLEEICEHTHNCFFMDLFVRPSNVPAVTMYRKMGYVVFRTIPNYYGGDEDGYDMRKPLPRDRDLKCLEKSEEKPPGMENFFGHGAATRGRAEDTKPGGGGEDSRLQQGSGKKSGKKKK
uniref:N-acetyltransferase domain-containing protein n=1 Tax=Chromera velia CCMP2878 TaxID=1169474 RepID=A0A0G4GH28_9ALVE|eukprot:Cvel_21879.t1-p1 / transcript=Cvel_21879.t1 / gene=Cvel_21879 / organism=Chromera_velia_CCMP2878 / gene_product=N-alpha-acetyltransferase 20, putative / transcript_product=N-alpha-acetyltransferase 20, putative / location=Cvel_scaffold2092:9863-10474(+) / protein_length=204 / sequence_SO=supercontig / SO=protein_coding / is_pseudo=false